MLVNAAFTKVLHKGHTEIWQQTEFTSLNFAFDKDGVESMPSNKESNSTAVFNNKKKIGNDLLGSGSSSGTNDKHDIMCTFVDAAVTAETLPVLSPQTLMFNSVMLKKTSDEVHKARSKHEYQVQKTCCGRW